MKNSILKNNKKGFTLIELIIYIGIIGIVISGFVGYSLSVSGVRSKNYSAVTVQANARVVLQMMSRKIREAQSVASPLAAATSTQLVLRMSSVATTTFSNIDGILYMKETGLATTTLTDNEIEIDNLLFTNLAPTGERANIQIDLGIKYRVTAGDTQFGYGKSYRTAVSPRI